MKLKSLIVYVFALAVLGSFGVKVHAQETKKIAGPNGGRIIATVEPRAEFLVLPDGKVQITFLDPAGKAIPPADQSVTVIAGERMSPTTLTFSKSGNTLLSNNKLPTGDAVPAVVQIKPTSKAKAVTEKFHVDLSKCGECKLVEYACICGH